MKSERTMRRVVVVGCSGVGKSTLARQLAARRGLTHIELDALFHQENWTPAPKAAFQAGIRQALDEADRTTDGWTVCGNYNSQTDAIHIERADTLIWLDLPRATVMRRVIGRTVSRAITRQELWNGNREPLTNFWHWDPEENIIRWSWVQYPKYQVQYGAKLIDGSWDHLTVHHLRTPTEADDLLASAGTDGGDGGAG